LALMVTVAELILTSSRSVSARVGWITTSLPPSVKVIAEPEDRLGASASAVTATVVKAVEVVWLSSR
jgi:hypothetical protein